MVNVFHFCKLFNSIFCSVAICDLMHDAETIESIVSASDDL